MTVDPITRADFDQFRSDMSQQLNSLRLELRLDWRREMITNTRWLAGLFVGQFIATVGATAGVVGWMLSHWGHFSS